MPLAQIYKGRHRSVFYFGGLLKARGAVGVSVEANFDAVCCLDVVDSNSRSCAFLCVGCFLLFAFEDILSPPAATHKHTFRAGVGNKIQQPKWAQRIPPPQHSVLHSSGLWSLDQRCSCQTAVGASALFLSGSKSHTSSSRLWLGSIMENVMGCGTSSCVCADLKVAEVNRNAEGLWASAVSEHLPKSPAHLWMTRHEQVTAVINIRIPMFALLASLRTSTWRV